jgi:hypothetical protein
VASPVDVVGGALREVDAARKRVSAGKSKQVTQADALDYLKSVGYAWFKSHRPSLQDKVPATELSAVDGHLERVLTATEKASARTTYVGALKDAKEALITLRSALLTAPTVSSGGVASPPDFSRLASDTTMREILVGRWNECQRCLQAQAHMAATVMMGGFLEALFVARANQLVDKGPMFRTKVTPLDGKTRKPLALSEWTLRHYIDVGQELGWISRSGKDVAAVLRDYRNYIHPEKQRSHGVMLNAYDSAMFWEVTKSLTQQLLK